MQKWLFRTTRVFWFESVDMLPSHGVTFPISWRGRIMSTSLLYHRFGIVGYRYVSQDFISGATFFRIEQPRERLRCSDCGSDEVHAPGGIVRRFLGLPIRKQPTFIRFQVPRVACW